MVYCVWRTLIPHTAPKLIKIRQLKKCNPELFITDIVNINWEKFQSIPSVEDAWNYFYSEVLNIIDKHAPWKVIRVKGKHLPWITAELLNLFREKDRAWKKYHKTRNFSDHDCYKKLRNLCTTKTRNAKASYCFGINLIHFLIIHRKQKQNF